jgi:hypothetical protein
VKKQPPSAFKKPLKTLIGKLCYVTYAFVYGVAIGSTQMIEITTSMLVTGSCQPSKRSIRLLCICVLPDGVIGRLVTPGTPDEWKKWLVEV